MTGGGWGLVGGWVGIHLWFSVMIACCVVGVFLYVCVCVVCE